MWERGGDVGKGREMWERGWGCGKGDVAYKRNIRLSQIVLYSWS